MTRHPAHFTSAALSQTAHWITFSLTDATWTEIQNKWWQDSYINDIQGILIIHVNTNTWTFSQSSGLPTMKKKGGGDCSIDNQYTRLSQKFQRWFQSESETNNPWKLLLCYTLVCKLRTGGRYQQQCRKCSVHIVSCKMATLLNELTRVKVHVNNPIPVGTTHGTHDWMWLSIAQTYCNPTSAAMVLQLQVDGQV